MSWLDSTTIVPVSVCHHGSCAETYSRYSLRAYNVPFHEEVPQTMLTLLHQTTAVHPCQFSLLEALLEEPFPQTPNDLLQLEQHLSAAAAQVADHIVLAQLTRAHEAEAFVTQALAHARARSPVPLVHKGFRVTSVLLLGGTRILLETPYLREDRRGRRGRHRRTRGPSGAGCYPVLEALGIADPVSPATRAEVALHVVQAASYREAAAMLARRGLACDVSSLVRISTATAEASIRLRDAALAAALRVPVRRCSKGVDLVLDGYPKLIAIDEEPDYEIVHSRRLGKADRATYEPFNPRPQIDVFAFDFLCIGLAHFVLRGVNMALVGAPPIRLQAADP